MYINNMMDGGRGLSTIPNRHRNAQELQGDCPGLGASGEGGAHLTIRRAHAMSTESQETAPRDDTRLVALLGGKKSSESSDTNGEKAGQKSSRDSSFSFTWKLPFPRNASFRLSLIEGCR